MTTDTPRTDACPHCKCQTKDPFGMGKTIHNVENCKRNRQLAELKDEAEGTPTPEPPRTDAAFGQGKHGGMKLPYETSFQLERELQKAEAELKEIRDALGDDGRRTHKEILEMAFKASAWREWKQKYIDLRNAHIAEGQDPAGTIWEHADKLQKELAASKAEVERLNSELSDMECEVWAAAIDSTEMARLKAEVAFWKVRRRAE